MPLLLAFLAAVLAMAIGYAWGVRSRSAVAPPPSAPDPAALPEPAPAPAPVAPSPSASVPDDASSASLAVAERARLIRSYEGEAAALRRHGLGATAAVAHLTELADERRALFGALADAKTQLARYRQLVLDIENDAPPPLLGGRGTPDDLKLIVGVGPVLERMLHQLGVTSYRQIARWTERDIDDFDARLAEFPGRIRRDAWVTQARALHQSLHGESL